MLNLDIHLSLLHIIQLSHIKLSSYKQLNWFYFPLHTFIFVFNETLFAIWVLIRDFSFIWFMNDKQVDCSSVAVRFFDCGATWETSERSERSVEDAVNKGLNYKLELLDCPGKHAGVLFADFSSSVNTIIPPNSQLSVSPRLSPDHQLPDQRGQ